ncbi:YihY/virulence factor BrkB family protein [Streptomyces sp. NPDC048290]|uniref:YihY/virulence factor BrkB family protein n=1 Tax=Streptomyces sp. NPDC048290 TaxID=3155811 RepID=UPI003447436D
MDWLKKLPLVGPVVARLMTTHAWRSYERLDRVKWTRLAAAVTFISFIALFPLLTVVAAIAAGTLSASRRAELEEKIADQVPGISDQLDIGSLVDNAGTVGLVAGAVLLLTGIGWVGSTRDCLRAVWELPDAEENPILRRGKDAGVLLGLGGALLITLVASTVGTALVGWIVDHLGIDEAGWGSVLLRVAAFAVAVLADFLVLLYVLTLLPGVEPPRRRLIEAALIGAVGFELLKLLLSGYIQGVAAKSMYGAFGVPVALLLWINFTAKLVLFCAAWTAARNGEAEAPQETEAAREAGTQEGAKGEGAEEGAKEEGAEEGDSEAASKGPASAEQEDEQEDEQGKQDELGKRGEQGEQGGSESPKGRD